MQYYSPVQQNWESMTSVKPQPSFAAAESRMFSLSQWGINHFHICVTFSLFSASAKTQNETLIFCWSHATMDGVHQLSEDFLCFLCTARKEHLL